MSMPQTWPVPSAEEVGAAPNDRPAQSVPLRSSAARILRRHGPLTLGLAGAYVLLAEASGRISGISESAGAFWLPLGLVYAAAVAFGPRSWAGIFLGLMAFELTLGSTQWATALLLATGNLAAAVCITTLMPRATIQSPSPHDRQDPLSNPALLLRSLGALVIGSAINALFGTLAYRGVTTEPVWALLEYAGTFMVGDLGAALLLGPLLLQLKAWRRASWAHQAPGAAALLLATMGALHLLLMQHEPWALAVGPAFILFTAMYTALRHEPEHVTLFNGLVCAELILHAQSIATTVFDQNTVLALLVMQGTGFTVACTSLLIASNRSVVVKSLAEARRLNESLARTEASARIGSWRLDLRDNRLFWSDQTFELFGRTPQQDVPDYEHFLSLVHPDDAAALDQAWTAALRGEPYDHVHRIIIRSEVRWLRERAEFEFDATGQPMQAWGSVQDITDEIRLQTLERERERAEAASQAKSQFLATLSHEIRTPLNGVIGMAQLLQDHGLDDSTRQLYLQQIHSSARLLNEIVTDVLDLSKIEAGRMDVERIPYSVRGTLRSLRDGYTALAAVKGISFELIADAELPDRLMGDPTRLRQILQNYLNNALKFTDRGSITLEARREADTLLVEVRDTGIGVPLHLQSTLFEPFSQIKSPSAPGAVGRSRPAAQAGTGLGLAICRALATLMGGSTGLHSAPGRGSVFWVRLPLEPAVRNPSTPAEDAAVLAPAPSPSKARGVSQDRPQQEPPDRLKGLRILLAEDNPVNRLVAVRLLERQGAEVTAVEDGHAALRALGLRADSGKESTRRSAYDLMLLDIHMPGLDGLAVAQEVRRRERESDSLGRLAILAMTAGVLPEQKAAALAAGMDGFVPKPFELQRLLAAIEEHAGPVSATDAACAAA